MPRNGHGQTEEYKGGDKAEEEEEDVSLSLFAIASLLCAQQPNHFVRGEGGTVGGGRFGFPLFALVSMTICHQSVTRNKDGKSEWSKFGEMEGAAKRGGWEGRIVGGLVGSWHPFFGVTMGAGRAQLGLS